MEKFFNFSFTCVWMLPPNSFARDVAGHFVQFQSDRQSLFAGHLTIAFDLFVSCNFCIHVASQ